MTGVNKRLGLGLVAVLLALVVAGSWPGAARAEESRYFPETGQTVEGRFLRYWLANGGLPVFGYPIGPAQPQLDPETGRTYLTQWFERNRFEYHPELAGTRYEVLLGLLGKDLRREALLTDSSFQRAVPIQLTGVKSLYFMETGHNISSEFLDYWLKNGGLQRFGYPISENRDEIDPETGQAYSMQWFERARFEYHPENKPPFDVLLGLLGNQLKRPTSKIEYTRRLDKTQLYYPTGLAVDAQDNLYVTSTYDFSFKIHKYDSQGRLVLAFARPNKTEDGNLYRPGDLMVDSQGNIYVAELGLLYSTPTAVSILKFDAQGRFLKRWGGYGTGDGQFNQPVGLVSDAANNIYVLDQNNHSVQKFDSEGNFLLKWGSRGSGDGQFQQADGFAIDRQGYLYVADAEGPSNDGPKTPRIQKFDGQGKLLQKWGSGPGAIPLRFGYGSVSFYPSGLAVDAQDNLFILDGNNSRLLKFDRDGVLRSFMGQRGNANGEFNYTNDLVLDSQGNLYASDGAINGVPDLDRVQKFRQR